MANPLGQRVSSLLLCTEVRKTRTELLKAAAFFDSNNAIAVPDWGKELAKNQVLLTKVEKFRKLLTAALANSNVAINNTKEGITYTERYLARKK